MIKKNYQLSKIYKNASDLIKRNGWWGGHLKQSFPGDMCLMQSIWEQNAPLSILRTNEAVAKGLVNLKLKNGPHVFNGEDATQKCIAWNDDPSRTKEQVLSLLDYAAYIYG